MTRISETGIDSQLDVTVPGALKGLKSIGNWSKPQKAALADRGDNLAKKDDLEESAPAEFKFTWTDNKQKTNKNLDPKFYKTFLMHRLGLLQSKKIYDPKTKTLRDDPTYDARAKDFDNINPEVDMEA